MLIAGSWLKEIGVVVVNNECTLLKIILDAVKRKLNGCEHEFILADSGWYTGEFVDRYVVSYMCKKCGKVIKIKR